MTDKFDEWFEETYPEYTIAETHTFIEPYYSLAQEAYATGEKESAISIKRGYSCNREDIAKKYRDEIEEYILKNIYDFSYGQLFNICCTVSTCEDCPIRGLL